MTSTEILPTGETADDLRHALTQQRITDTVLFYLSCVEEAEEDAYYADSGAVASPHP